MDKLLGLEHLRAIAITMVFFYHYQLFGHPEWLENSAGFGWTGVDLFFVLSGFLISGQLFKTIRTGQAISLKVFFIKRFFRIIPAYLVILILYALFAGFREREAMAPLWRYLTFTLNFGLDLKKTGTFTHAWSLCIEEQFYLLFPVLVLLLKYFNAAKKTIFILTGLFITGFLLRYLSWQYLTAHHLFSDYFILYWYKYIYYPTYNRLDGLLVGVGIAGLLNFYPAIKERADQKGNVLLVIGLVLLSCAYFLCKDNTTFYASVFGFPLVSIAFGFIVAGAASYSSILYRLQSKVTSVLANLSYTLYLVHKMVIHLSQNTFQNLGIEKDSNIMLIICIATSITAALVLRYTVELPFLRIRDKALYLLNKQSALVTSV